MTAAEKRLKFYIERQKTLTHEEINTFIGKWVFERILYLTEAIKPGVIEVISKQINREVGNYK